VRKPAVRKPAVRKPTARKPTVRKPAVRKPMVRKPTARKPAARRRVAPVPLAVSKYGRWLPTGTGVWTNKWSKTSAGNPLRVVRTAKLQKVTHIFVKTGTLRGGFDGAPVLARILPATRGTNIKIVAWDFPMLRDPLGDAARLAAAARFSAGPGMPRVAAVAPDIETRAEGTRLTTGGIVVYYRELRRLLPPDVAILATVPWPSDRRVGRYPYAVTAQFADAFIPMAYWFNRSPVSVTEQSIRYLERFGRPVMPAGMAYDPALDGGRGLADPTASDLATFASASRRSGAPAVSFWAWQTASADHWRGIHAAAIGFPEQPEAFVPPMLSDPMIDIPVGNARSGGPFDRPY
jgi:hypothetical protein